MEFMSSSFVEGDFCDPQATFCSRRPRAPIPLLPSTAARSQMQRCIPRAPNKGGARDIRAQRQHSLPNDSDKHDFPPNARASRSQRLVP